MKAGLRATLQSASFDHRPTGRWHSTFLRKRAAGAGDHEQDEYFVLPSTEGGGFAVLQVVGDELC